MSELRFPSLSLVVLVGASGAGKSSFARKHFKPTEVLSSDFFRGLVSDDETSLDASKDAFEALNFVAAKRLAAGRLTVVDATNVQPDARKPLLALAKEHDVVPVAIVLDLPAETCHERNRDRPDRDFGAHVVRNHVAAMRRSLRTLRREGFRYVHHLKGEEEIDAATLVRERPWTDRRDETGPFDLVGDVHGCLDELTELLAKLGYAVAVETAADGGARYRVTPPEGRRAVFLGDLCDRGPDTPGVFRLVMDMCADGAAIAIPGNHDVKLARKLRGRDVMVSHGLGQSLEQLEKEPAGFADRVATFVEGLVSHFVLDGGRLVVAHAGMIERYQGRASARVRAFALYGETTGETDEQGLPIRLDWAQHYRGAASVVYGHLAVAEPEWLNRTVCIDTGCVFGGRLTALRWPEKDLVSVPARKEHYAPLRPLVPPRADASPDTADLTAQQAHDDVLDLADVTGRRAVHTRLHHSVTLREEQTEPALEAMSRFAMAPQWLVHLPPTMSPPETSSREGLLEHPDEAFAYYRSQGVARAVCEEKHMGSRAIAVVARDAAAARARFGATQDETGAVFTRTGRPFFADVVRREALLARVRAAIDRAGLWDELTTDWFVLDCELMPWSAKARELIRTQYAAVAAAANAGLAGAVSALERAAARGLDVGATLDRTRLRAAAAVRYAAAYRPYCWEVASIDDLRLAPFHVLASEGAVHVDKDHRWHMATLARLAGDDPVLVATRHREVDLADEASVAAATAWWEEMTAAGGEGMVVKPLDFVVHGPKGLAQPAVKCRGREYLRIIYGPEYDLPEHLERLRQRGLGAKRSLALREFALGVEALERFVRREPLRRVHECVFGVLALETEPVDPRL